ncbi:MAG: hypothetical protein RBT71_01070 [Flavobacteriales bacterium]|jgi:hypothetical protein|nr:hypothetical protein [Flavobacteriales bacterium]
MSGRRGSGKAGTGLLAVLTIVPLVAAAAVLGPERAWAIARAAVGTALCDPMAEDTPRHRIPEVHLAPSPDDHRQGTWHDGASAVHFNQGDAFISLERTTPIVPVRHLVIAHRGMADMVQAHLALWAAGRMGVLTTWAAPVWHATPGGPGAVKWLHEAPSPDYLADRGFAGASAVFVRHANGRWAVLSGTDGTPALDTLAAILADSARSLMDRRDALARTIDVEAALRCAAVMEALPPAPVRPLWTRIPPQDRWAPVLDVSYGFRDGGDDPILAALEAEPEWQARKLDLMREAHHLLVDRGALVGELDRVVAAMRPSLRADRDKLGRLAENDTNLMRIPLARVEDELARLRDRLTAQGADDHEAR